MDVGRIPTTLIPAGKDFRTVIKKLWNAGLMAHDDDKAAIIDGRQRPI
jgi:hypothetical protein